MSEVILNKILTELTGVKKEVGELKQDVGGLKKDVGELKKEQITTNKRLSNIEERQDVIIDHTGATYSQTGKLTEYHDQTMLQLEKLATKEDVDYLNEKIGEHDREIYKLKHKK